MVNIPEQTMKWWWWNLMINNWLIYYLLAYYYYSICKKKNKNKSNRHNIYIKAILQCNAKKNRTNKYTLSYINIYIICDIWYMIIYIYVFAWHQNIDSFYYNDNNNNINNIIIIIIINSYIIHIYMKNILFHNFQPTETWLYVYMIIVSSIYL